MRLGHFVLAATHVRFEVRRALRNHFWCHVLQGSAKLLHLLTRLKVLAQSKICELDGGAPPVGATAMSVDAVVHQQILRLDVAVHVTVLVAVSERPTGLANDVTELLL